MNAGSVSRLARVAALGLLVLATAQIAPSNARATGLVIENLVQWADTAGGNQHVYGFVRMDDLTWNDAAVMAATEVMLGSTGHMATITSAAEMAFIEQNVLPAGNPGAPNEQAFAGGVQMAGMMFPGIGWGWDVTGEAWSYTNWAVGQPGFVASEDFLAVMLQTTRGKWYDVTDNSPDAVGFLIEFDTTQDLPDPVVLPEPDGALLLAGALAALALIRRR